MHLPLQFLIVFIFPSFGFRAHLVDDAVLAYFNFLYVFNAVTLSFGVCEGICYIRSVKICPKLFTEESADRDKHGQCMTSVRLYFVQEVLVLVWYLCCMCMCAITLAASRGKRTVTICHLSVRPSFRPSVRPSRYLSVPSAYSS